MGPQRDTSSGGKPSGKGKTTKRFLELNEVLQLASSISDAQEQKTLEKAEKHHKAQPGQPKTDTKPRISASKAKLKETKALLAAQRSQSKKERTKKRKRRSQETLPGDGDQTSHSDSGPGKVARKKVSFA